MRAQESVTIESVMTEEIFGLDTNADDAARIMNSFVRKDWVEMESSLYRGKWFDYRFMNPVQATYLYAHEYIRFYKMAYAKNFDTERAEFVRPLNVETLFSEQNVETQPKAKQTYHKRKISGIWRGRMFADAMGMPYAEYLEFAFFWSMRFWRQNYLPRPEQLYTDLVIDRATTAWDERSGAMLFFSKLPQYKNGVYRDIVRRIGDQAYEGRALHSQNAHHEWLLDQVNNRANDPELFARLIWEHEVLPEEKVRQRLGADGFELIEQHAERYPQAQRYN